MKVKLKQLSVCPCGFPCLDESIPIGTEYNIHPQFKDTFDFICGGCGKQQKLVGVLADSRTGGNAGFLPEVLFGEPEPEPSEQKTMLLTEILTEAQLNEVERILNSCGGDRMKATKGLRVYFATFAKELLAKGVVSDYLAYVIAYKQWTGGDNGGRTVSFSA